MKLKIVINKDANGITFHIVILNRRVYNQTSVLTAADYSQNLEALLASYLSSVLSMFQMKNMIFILSALLLSICIG